MPQDLIVLEVFPGESKFDKMFWDDSDKEGNQLLMECADLKQESFGAESDGTILNVSSINGIDFKRVL